MSANANQISTLYFAALEQESAKRSAFLSGACQGDDELKSQLEQMIAAHEQAKGFLSDPPRQLCATKLHSDSNGIGCGSVLDELRMELSLGQVDLDDADDKANEPPIEAPIPNRVGNRYQLHGEIARGGMGLVLKGRDVDLGRNLAVKVLLESHRDNPEVVSRFVEEAQIGGQLQHPGIAPVYELGQFPDERPFFSMKLVKGETLAALLAKRKDAKQDRGKLLAVFEQVCQTMAYAHSRRVIHRDLKPANIMVGAFGEVQVMDWGLAKVLANGGIADERRARDTKLGQSLIQTIRNSDTEASIGTKKSFGSVGSDTQMGSVMGTLAYMAPEQALGEVDRLDGRCDVFGLGAILCEILTGHPPYVAEDSSDLLPMATRCQLVDCHRRLDDSGADDALIDLVKHCLQPEPVDRPAGGRAVAEQVTAHLESVETRLREAEVERAAEATRAIEETKRRRLTIALAASIVTMLTLGFSYWMWQENRNHKQAIAANQRVKSSLNEARLQQGRAAKSDSPAQQQIELEKALISAQQASAAAEADGVKPQTHAETVMLVGHLNEEAERVRKKAEQEAKNEKIRRRLEAIRLSHADTSQFNAEQVLADGVTLDAGETSQQYRQAFLDAGIDLFSTNIDQQAESIQRSEIGDSLISSLDHWLSTIPDTKKGRFEQLRSLSQWESALPHAERMLKEKGANSVTWVTVAPVFALAEGGKKYPHFCERAVQNFATYPASKQENDIFLAERILKSCLLLPDAIAPERLPVAEHAAQLDQGKVHRRFAGYLWSARALHAYRSGNFLKARTYAETAGENLHDEYDRAMHHPIYAMILHQLDDAKAAQENVIKGRKLIQALHVKNRERRSRNSALVAREGGDTLFATILQREAEKLIQGSMTTPLSEIGYTDDDTDFLMETPIVVRERISKMLDRADTNPWRKSIRQALLENDLQKIQQLTSDLQVALPSSEMIAWLGSSLRRLDAHDLAVDVLRDAQRKTPSDFWINYELASSLLETKRFSEALSFARATYAVRPNSLSANWILFDSLYENRQYDQARTHAERFLSTETLEDREYYALSTRLRKRSLVSTLPISPLLGGPMSKGCLELSLASCRKAVEHRSGSWNMYHRQLGTLLLWLDRRDEAIEVFRELTNKSSWQSSASRALGLTLLLDGQFQEAESAFRQSLKRAESDARVLLIACLQLQGKADATNQVLAGMDRKRRSPARMVATLVAFNCCMRKRMWSEAKDLLQSALKQASRKEGDAIKVMLAQVLINKGDLQEADELLREQMERLDQRIAPALLLARLPGTRTEGLAIVDRFLAETSLPNTRKAILQNDMAWIRATVPLDGGFGDIDIAEKAIRQVIAVHPHHPSVANTLGVVLYRQGKWVEAIAELENGLFLGKESPESWLFLAMAHWKAGDEVEADRWFAVADQWRAEHASTFEQRRFYDEATELLYY